MLRVSSRSVSGPTRGHVCFSCLALRSGAQARLRQLHTTPVLFSIHKTSFRFSEGIREWRLPELFEFGFLRLYTVLENSCFAFGRSENCEPIPPLSSVTCSLIDKLGVIRILSIVCRSIIFMIVISRIQWMESRKPWNMSCPVRPAKMGLLNCWILF